MRRVWMTAGFMVALVGCGGSSTSPNTVAQVTTSLPAPAAATTTIFPALRTKTALCRLNGALPDAACTPGALNPSVTQATIAATICTSGWTDTVRPPTSVTDRLKAEVATEYGLADPLSTFEGDHLIPLELGGAPADVANFWDEPMSLKLPDGTLAASPQKDTLENALKAGVCAGRMTLLDAQRQIATDWLGTWTALGKPGATVAATAGSSTSSTAAPAATAITAAPVATTTPPVASTAAPVATTAPAPTTVTAGAFCSPEGATGYSKTGVFYTCKTSATDNSARWRQ